MNAVVFCRRGEPLGNDLCIIGGAHPGSTAPFTVQPNNQNKPFLDEVIDKANRPIEYSGVCFWLVSVKVCVVQLPQADDDTLFGGNPEFANCRRWGWQFHKERQTVSVVRR